MCIPIKTRELPSSIDPPLEDTIVRKIFLDVPDGNLAIATFMSTPARPHSDPGRQMRRQLREQSDARTDPGEPAHRPSPLLLSVRSLDVIELMNVTTARK